MNMRAVDKCSNDGSEQSEKKSRNEDPFLTSAKETSSQSVVDGANTPDEQRFNNGTSETMTQDSDTLKPQVGGNESNNASFLQSLLEFYEKTKAFIIGSFSVILGLVLWHLATKYNFNFYINFENIPSPLAVGTAFVAQLADSEFYIHIMVSMKRILLAYSIAVVLGIGIGLVVGRSRSMRAAVLPYIEIIRPIPAVAWIPLAILMWPTEESSIIYITFLGALFPIILNTVHGVEQTPEVLVRAALSLGAKNSQVFRHVVFPAALPSIGAGLAIGMGVSWFSLLAGEIISGQYGIGYFTWNAYSLINYPDIVVGMLVIGGLGSLSTFLVRLAMRPSLRWKNSQR
ncbi:MAG: NitT/TauT family transport system permease protein [Oleiphilaceae bacterium]|jgi:NitT/TauT family transport system permease protein